MASYFSLWIKIFIVLAMIALIVYFTWMKFKPKEENKRKKSAYSLKQMKEVR